MERIWWNQVPNALKFFNRIADNLAQEKSVVFISSHHLPWENYFFSQIKETFREHSASKNIEELSDIENPGEYLLAEYCKREKRALYRPSKGYAKFFAENDDIVLHERVFILRINQTDLLVSWMDFVSDYIKERGKEKSKAVFLIECVTDKKISNKKGLPVISFDDHIGDYDRFIFCMLSSSCINENDIIRSYLSELAANISGNDIELCEKVLKDYRNFLLDSYQTIKDIVTGSLKDDGSKYAFEKNQRDVKHDIWLSQVKIIYPILENYRETFVKENRYSIEKNLPISSSSGEKYNQPEDVELGTLRFLADNRRIIISTDEYYKLKAYTEARNRLSHLDVLSFDEIKNLLLPKPKTIFTSFT